MIREPGGKGGRSADPLFLTRGRGTLVQKQLFPCLARRSTGHLRRWKTLFLLKVVCNSFRCKGRGLGSYDFIR